MVEPEHVGEALFPERVGDRLRVARLKAGLDLTDIAAKTRVPLRHLSAIESGDYSSFPSSTYCVGFVKAYARAVGEDDASLARDLRAELGEVRTDPREFYEVDDADPARLPTARLAWTAALILVVLAGAYWAFRQWQVADPRDDAPTIIAAAPGKGPVIAPAPTRGQVVLTATAPVWVRIYDAEDVVLLQKEMAAGETFIVPPAANNPRIRTGRPELIKVMVDGQPVPPLGPAERMIKDIGISAPALAARTTPSAAPAVPMPTAQAEPARPQPSRSEPVAPRSERSTTLQPPSVNTSTEAAAPPPTATP